MRDAAAAVGAAAAPPRPATACTTALRHVLAARGIRGGYTEFLAVTGRDLAARKARLALVVLALEADTVHSMASLAGNHYFQGPFYAHPAALPPAEST